MAKSPILIQILYKKAWIKSENMEYTILEEESGLHIIFSPFLRALERHKNVVKDTVKNWIFYRKKDRFRWAYYLPEFNDAGKNILEKVINEKSFSEQISSGVRKYSTELFDFSEKTAHINLKEKSNQELARIFREYSSILENLYYWGLFIEVMEVYNSLYSTFVKRELIELIEKKNLNKNADEYLAMLAIPNEESFVRKQEKDFLRIVSSIQRDPDMLSLFENSEVPEIIRKIDGTPINKMIDTHLDKYCWVNYNYEGPEMDKTYIVDLLTHAARTINPEQNLEELGKKESNNKKIQEIMMKELDPGKFVERLLLTAREFGALKMIRKDCIFFGSYAMDKVRKEMCIRFGITLDQCRCMNDSETIAALENGIIDKEELKAREEEMAQLLDEGVEKIFTGEKARELNKRIIEIEVKDVKELVGSCASPGKVTGIVRIISHIDDISKMEQGDILVANATNPSFVPAMKKAAAIVTDMGGITCHAAIVSRELGVPCVVGTKAATKLLKDGDEVEVDAAKGIVKILKRSN